MSINALKVCYFTHNFLLDFVNSHFFSAIDDAAREAKRISLETGSAPIPSDTPGSEELSMHNKEVSHF